MSKSRAPKFRSTEPGTAEPGDRGANVVAIDSKQRLAELPSACMGTLVSYSPEHGPLVDFAGNPAGPVAARSLVALDETTLQAAVTQRQTVGLVFERGDPGLPLILGLVQPVVLRRAAPATARVDGKRVVITGEEEVELRCGEASIVLTRAGKLVIRGAHVETRARGVNRIKGGSVQIN